MICLNPNLFQYYNTGVSGTVPQMQQFNYLAKMYDYWLVERIEMEFTPTTMTFDLNTGGQ